MSQQNIKLISKQKAIFMLVVFLLGASGRTMFNYYHTGLVDWRAIYASIASFIVGAVILLLVVWWANKPEEK